jgi:hypothetical protein
VTWAFENWLPNTVSVICQVLGLKGFSRCLCCLYVFKCLSIEVGPFNVESLVRIKRDFM